MRPFDALFFGGEPMKSVYIAIGFGVSCVSLSAQTIERRAIPDSAVVLRVGEENITRAGFERLIKVLNVPAVPEITPERMRVFVDRIVQIKTFAQQARLRESDPAVWDEVRFRVDQALADFEMSQMVRALAPTEDALREYYKENQEEFVMISARHILIRFTGSIMPRLPTRVDITEEEALARSKVLRERLTQGEDFATVAKSESDDIATRTRGGELGMFGRGRIDPEFERVAFSLTKGELSNPVRTSYGFHLIQISDRTVRPFEDVRVEIEAHLRREVVAGCQRDVSGRANIVLNKTYFANLPDHVTSPTCGVR